MPNNIYFNSNKITESNSTKENLTLNKQEVLTPQLFEISKFYNEKDIKPKTAFLSWDECCEHLSAHQKRRDKFGAPCWSPCIYSSGTTRKKENVIRISMAVIDVDNGHSVDSLIQLIHGYTYLIHSSFSHTKDMPKYRVILPLSQTIDAAEWPLAWSRINSWLGGINDPATKDASRLYYMPVCPLDSQDAFVSTGIGKLLDVSYLPELSTELKKELKQSTEWNKSIQIEGIEPIPPDALDSESS